jgi:hypothetical protein
MHGLLPTVMSITNAKSGYAAGLSAAGALSAFSVAKFTTSAPTPPPTPPPSPPRPGQTQYGDPHDGPCESGEFVVALPNAPGAFCAPQCTGPALRPSCPKGSLPLNASGLPCTAEPACALQDEDTGDRLCALECDDDSDCPAKATCKSIGVCTYDDAGPTPPPTPPTPPTPAPPTPAPGTTHYGNPNLYPCLAGEVDVNLTGWAPPGASVCAPTCNRTNPCPTDTPGGMTGKPVCGELNDHKIKLCVIGCDLNSDCGGGASGPLKHAHCDNQASIGLQMCYYDNKTNSTTGFSLLH